jgi:hypothetical protein
MLQNLQHRLHYLEDHARVTHRRQSDYSRLAERDFPTSRFDLDYNAAHALSLAALRKQGYRSENRYLVFQCLQYTLELPNEQWRILDQAHRKRNIAEYEGEVDIDEQLVDAIVRIADEVVLRLGKG